MILPWFYDFTMILWFYHDFTMILHDFTMIFVSNQSVDPVDDPPEIRRGAAMAPAGCQSPVRYHTCGGGKKTRPIPTGYVIYELLRISYVWYYYVLCMYYGYMAMYYGYVAMYYGYMAMYYGYMAMYYIIIYGYSFWCNPMAMWLCD